MSDANIQQQDFRGGINAQYTTLRPDGNSYPLLVNGRTRANEIAPIRSPLRDTNVATGVYQNLTGVGSTLIIVVSGRAYYRDTVTNNGWRPVVGVSLDPTADVIDSCPVPASTINFKRTGPIESVRFTNSAASNSTEGLILTDGITQPSFVYPSGDLIEGRATQTYDQWSDSGVREYVPIGRYPVMAGSRMFMAIKGPSGYLNRIACSVSGRPVDFVMNIDDQTGDKTGDALTTATAAGLDSLSGLYSVPGDTGTFVATTLRETKLMAPVANSSFFGEFRYAAQTLFPVGVVNNQSAVDINGDSAFISPFGVHSFNAVLQNKYESQNEPISADIYRLLATTQTYGATCDFMGYAFFSLETVFGPAVLVYDKLMSKFVSIDMYAGIGQIKQFAKVFTSTGVSRLFFITSNNQLYEFGAADTWETCRFYIGDWNSGTGNAVLSLRRVSAVFANVTEETQVSVTTFHDRALGPTVTIGLQPADVNTAPIISVPMVLRALPSVRLLDYSLATPGLQFACGAMLEWASPATLNFLTLGINTLSANPTALANGYLTGTPIPAQVQKFALVGDFDGSSTCTAALLRLAEDYTIIGLGDFLYTANHTTDWAAYARTLQVLMEAGRMFNIAGNHDLDYDSGAVYMNKLGNGTRYGYRKFGTNVLFASFNTGWKTSTLGVNGVSALEPDGNQYGEAQYNKLAGTLATSTARFKFLFLHEPMYSSGNYYPGYPLIRDYLRGLGIAGVFNGHDHNYQRHNVNGLNYFTIGTGGRARNGIRAVRLPSFQAGRDDTFGYLDLQVDTYSARTKFVSTDGLSDFDHCLIHP